jgi:hypothetical protein
LQANHGDARFLYAVPSAMQASPVIIATGEPVMALGGFTGGDPILTPDALATVVARNTVRFFLLPAAGGFPFGPPGPAGFPGGPPAVGDFSVGPPAVDGFSGGPPGPPGLGRSEITRWVSDHCAAVPAALWRSDGEMADMSRPKAPPAPPGFGGAMQLYDCASPAGSADPDHVTVSNILDAASLVGGIL